MSKIYIHDIGATISVNTDMVLTGATLTELSVLKPSGVSVAWTASISPLDNKVLVYTTLLGDLNESGIYQLQANIHISGKQLLGDTTSFTVYGNFQ